MKIAVNTRLLIKNKLDGIGCFTFETFTRITAQHPEHEFIYLFDRPYDKSFITSSNIIPVVLKPQARHPFLFVIWFEYAVKQALKKYKADLFISPDGYTSLSTKTKTLLVIHDLNFEHYPEYLPWLVRHYYKYFFPRFARKADHIATVSEFSKADIIKQYNISSDKIDVIYNGANDGFKPLEHTLITKVREKYTNGRPYFLFVGALHPRKNIVNLLKSYDLFRASTNYNFPLVIAGFKMWWTSEMEKTLKAMSYKNDVIFCGRLSSDDLYLIIGSAYAMVYVSCFEGFGIPILEAFYCNVPVITSNVTSMPEIANDAAILVNPFSVDSICNAMKLIASDEALKQTLIDKANHRKKLFSWDKTASLLWKVIEKIL